MQNRLSSTLFLIFGLAFNERYIHTHIKERRHCHSPTLSGERKRQKRGWCVNFGESCSRRRHRRRRRRQQKLFKTAKGMRLGCVCMCMCVRAWRKICDVERAARKKG